MKKEFRYLSTYNRYVIIGKVKAKLRELGAKILVGPFDEEMEIEVMTNENDIDKVKKLKASCPNLIVNSHWLKLSFIYNNTYYYLSWDDNPFFENRVEKIKLSDDGKTYRGDRYVESMESLHMCYDNIFAICDDNKMNNMVEDFWNKLLIFMSSAFESAVVSEKRRVYDYGNKYHYEKKYDNKIHYIFEDKDIGAYYSRCFLQNRFEEVK